MHINKKRIEQHKEDILQNGVQRMQQAPLKTQISFLGRAKASLLKSTIEAQAPNQMHDGAVALYNEGRMITVDALLKDGDNPYQLPEEAY